MLYSQSPAAMIRSDVCESRDITLSEVAHNGSLNYSPFHGILYLNVDASMTALFFRQSVFS